MDAKLTLKLDQAVIAQIKEYAKEQHESVSRLAESYFKSLVSSGKSEKKKNKNNFEEIEIPESIKRISGVISLPPDFDYKAEYRKHLEEKYL